MTIPFLSGNADPRVIEGIKKSAQELGDPQRPAREALKQAMANNTELAKQWTDRFKKDPTAVRNLFGKRVDKLFESGELSREAIVEDAARADIVGDTSLAEIDKRTGARSVAASKVATGQTPQERAQSAATLKRTQVAVDTDELQLEQLKSEQPFFESNAKAKNQAGLLNNAIQQGNVEALQVAQNYQAQIATFKDKYGNTPELIYNAYRSGKMSPEDMVATMAVPETRQLVEFQSREYWNAQDREFRLNIQNGVYETPDRLLKQANVIQARKLAEDSGGQFSATTIYNLMQDQTELKRLSELPEQPVDEVEAAKFRAARFLATERQRNFAINQARAQVQTDAANAKEFAIASDIKKPFAQRKAAAEAINQNERLILGEQGFPYRQFDVIKNRWFDLRNNDELVVKPGGTETTSSAIDKAAELLASGDGTNADLIKDTSFTAEEKAKIRTRAAQLKAKKP